jgi:hypothetical protein
LQPDFKEQKSLVQEVIEAAGHLCIFLLKFHCELNFIEFFWEVVKKYLGDNCNYTFATLKENMPKALESVCLSTIRLWEPNVHVDGSLQIRTWHNGSTAASYRILVQQSTNYTDTSQRLLHGLLIDARQYLKRHAKLGLIEIFYSFNFDCN